MKTGYRTLVDDPTGAGSDLGDLFIPRALFSDGGLWAWGSGPSGQLGTNNITNQSSPVQTVAGGTNWKLVACGWAHTAAIKTDGTLWLWGFNSNGQLGDNTVAQKSSPVQTVAGGTSWRYITAGNLHTAAIKTDGTLWSWGQGAYGQLGNNGSSDTSSPVQTVAGGTNWKSVATGCSSNHTAAIKTDGTLWLWGQNVYGQVGVNDTANRSSPVQTISSGTNWKSASCGQQHTAAVKTDGTLWLWGRNTYGQLGANDTTHRSSPIQTVAAESNWKSVACGLFHTAAIKTDGTLWTWGLNSSGQLGTNNITNQSSPVQTVASGTNWKSVAGGLYHTAAIKTDGTLWLWGYNSLGQLGNNNTTRQSSPVQTIAGGTNWTQVTCGANHTAATKDDY